MIELFGIFSGKLYKVVLATNGSNRISRELIKPKRNMVGMGGGGGLFIDLL